MLNVRIMPVSEYLTTFSIPQISRQYVPIAIVFVEACLVQFICWLKTVEYRVQKWSCLGHCSVLRCNYLHWHRRNCPTEKWPIKIACMISILTGCIFFQIRI